MCVCVCVCVCKYVYFLVPWVVLVYGFHCGDDLVSEC